MRYAVTPWIGRLGFLLVIACLTLTRSRAQTPAGSALPEIVGLRPGLSVEEAERVLKAYNPKATIKVGQVQVPEIGRNPLPATLLFRSSASPEMDVPETIQLELTLPPEKPVVWGILRRLVFDKGKERNRTALLDELRRTYGREGDGLTDPIVNIYWAFDEQGRRAETPDPASGHCTRPGPWDIVLNPTGVRATSSTFPGYSALLGVPTTSQTSCKPAVYVKALLQPATGRGFALIESTTVAVINGALAARAQASTAAYRTRKR